MYALNRGGIFEIQLCRVQTIKHTHYSLISVSIRLVKLYDNLWIAYKLIVYDILPLYSLKDDFMFLYLCIHLSFLRFSRSLSTVLY